MYSFHALVIIIACLYNYILCNCCTLMACPCAIDCNLSLFLSVVESSFVKLHCYYGLATNTVACSIFDGGMYSVPYRETVAGLVFRISRWRRCSAELPRLPSRPLFAVFQKLLLSKFE